MRPILLLSVAMLTLAQGAGAQYSGGGVNDPFGKDSRPNYNRQQSDARPFGLDIVDRVQRTGSDNASRDFRDNQLPGLQEFVDSNLQERINFGGALQHQINPGQLRLTTDAEVRTYFVTEGAGFHNTLGFAVNGEGVEDDSARLIFPDASIPDAFNTNPRRARRTSDYPVLPGDFVDLGTYSAGDTLDFFLVANGARGGTQVFDANVATNPDGLNHLVAFSYAVEDSPYLLIGFEDLFGGGDNDFNDLVFVIDVGRENVAALVAAPEPGTLAAFGIAGAAYLRRRRRLAQKKQALDSPETSGQAGGGAV